MNRMRSCSLVFVLVWCGHMIHVHQADAEQVIVGIDLPHTKLTSMDELDHGLWDGLLNRYVDSRGNVAYQQWLGSVEDRRGLDKYLARLSVAGPQLKADKSAQIAFWINAYNAVTVRAIHHVYPTTSIRNHTAKVIGFNIWKDVLLFVGGQKYTLQQMEHELLRRMDEPRIHFSIVCASRGCPRLLNESYTAEKLEEQLTKATREFFADRRHFRFDPSGKRMQMSAILDWYKEDFGDEPAAVLDTISPYLPTLWARRAAERNEVVISYLPYDWLLNDQATARNLSRQ